MVVRRLLHSAGYRYRLHGRYGTVRLPGRPDLVFAPRRKVIFINGCFWHSHSCRVGQTAPKSNTAFWAEKRRRTVERDAAQLALRGQGWDVLVVWECELKVPSELELRLTAFLGAPTGHGRTIARFWALSVHFGAKVLPARTLRGRDACGKRGRRGGRQNPGTP